MLRLTLKFVVSVGASMSRAVSTPGVVGIRRVVGVRPRAKAKANARSGGLIRAGWKTDALDRFSESFGSGDRYDRGDRSSSRSASQPIRAEPEVSEVNQSSSAGRPAGERTREKVTLKINRSPVRGGPVQSSLPSDRARPFAASRAWTRSRKTSCFWVGKRFALRDGKGREDEGGRSRSNRRCLLRREQEQEHGHREYQSFARALEWLGQGQGSRRRDAEAMANCLRGHGVSSRSRLPSQEESVCLVKIVIQWRCFIGRVNMRRQAKA
jgi:hypothetical protein